MLYGTHSVPLLKHFAHFVSLSTGSHLILCLLHSAPVHAFCERDCAHAILLWVLSTHRLLSAACAEQAGAHLRGPHHRLDASVETFPCHRAPYLKVLELVMGIGLDATWATYKVMVALVTCLKLAVRGWIAPRSGG